MIKITNEQDWHKYRAKGIGGSDAACVLGLNPWKTNTQLYEEKIGLRKPDDISGKAQVQYGKQCENLIRELFKLDYPSYKIEYSPYNLQQHKEHEFIIGSLDGIITDENGKKGVLEIKTTTIQRSFDFDKWNNQVPQNYYCQLCHYLACNDEFSFAILRALLKCTDKEGKPYSLIKDYRIERQEVKEDIEKLLNAEVEFWNEHVLKKKPPNLILPPLA